MYQAYNGGLFDAFRTPLLERARLPDAAYILDTFPVVREQDEAAFASYRTKDLVLGYLRAFKAGDIETRIVA